MLNAVGNVKDLVGLGVRSRHGRLAGPSAMPRLEQGLLNAVVHRAPNGVGETVALVPVVLMLLKIQIRHNGAIMLIGCMFSLWKAGIRMPMPRGTIHHLKRCNFIFVVAAIVHEGVSVGKISSG